MTRPRQHGPSRGTVVQEQHGLQDELIFLKAWEDGVVPFLGAIARIRQIRRANPAVAMADRLSGAAHAQHG